MRTLFSFLLAAVTCVTVASIAQATTYYIPAAGEVIDDVITQTTTGDVISVTGVLTYAPFTVNKAITVRNDTGTTLSITGTTGLAVSMAGGTTAIVEGFRFVGGTGSAIATGLNGEFKNCTFVDNGNGYSAGAVQLSGSAKLTDCTITMTATSYPRAVVLSGAGSKLVNCVITTPYVSANGDLPVVEMTAAAEVSGCTITLSDSTSAAVAIAAGGAGSVVLNNTLKATFDGIVASSGVSSVTGNVVQIRASGTGIQAASSGSTVIEKNTILSPACDSGIGILMLGTTATQQVKNNLFVNLDYGIYFNSGSTSATINHNIWWAACGVGSNLTLTSTQLANKEPLFCGARESSVQKYTQRIDSEAANGNNGWNELVGAKDVECAWGGLARSTTVPSNTVVTVLEDVGIGSSRTLFLNPGVQFKFDGHDESGSGAHPTKNELNVATTGKLEALGSSGNKIKFISGDATPAEGDWYGIDARAAAELDLDYVEVKHATYGVRPGVNNITTNEVSHSTFSDNEIYDIYCEYIGTPAPVLSNNTLTVGSGTGIRIEGPYGSGTTVSGNTITGNSSSVDGIDYGQWAGRLLRHLPATPSRAFQRVTECTFEAATRSSSSRRSTRTCTGCM